MKKIFGLCCGIVGIFLGMSNVFAQTPPAWGIPSAKIISVAQIPTTSLKVGGTFDEGYHFRMVMQLENTTHISLGLDNWAGNGNTMISSGNTTFVISENGVDHFASSLGLLQLWAYTEKTLVTDLDKPFVIDVFYKIPAGSQGGEYASMYRFKLENDPNYNFGRNIILTNISLWSLCGNQGQSDVLIASGDIVLDGPVKTSFVVDMIGGTINSIEAMKFVLGDKEFNWRKDWTRFLFDNVLIEKSGKIWFKIDIAESALVWEHISFKIRWRESFSREAFDGARYYDTNTLISSDNIRWSVTLESLQIQKGITSLENNLTKDVEFLADRASRRVVFDGTYTARKGAVKLNVFALSGTELLSLSENINFYLFIDGKEVGTTDKLGIDEVFSDIRVEAGKTVRVTIEAEVDVDSVHTYDYTLFLKGENDNGNLALVSTARLAKIKVVKLDPPVVSTLFPSNTVLLKSSNATIANFIVKPSNQDGVYLDEFTFSGKVNGIPLTANDLRVMVDGVEEEGINTGGMIQYVTNEYLPLAWVPVEMKLKNGLIWDVVLELKSLNNELQDKKFTKKFVNALVKVVKQENIGGSETRYTFNVEKYEGSEQVTNFRLFAGEIEKGGLSLVEDEGVLEVPNENFIQYITKIMYEVNGQEVNIEKNTFNDYFRIGDSFVKIFKVQ